MHRESQGIVVYAGAHRNDIEMLQERLSLVPWHSIRTIDDVIACERADRNTKDAGDSQLASQLQKFVLQLQEDVFSIIEQIHLVDCRHHTWNSQ